MSNYKFRDSATPKPPYPDLLEPQNLRPRAYFPSLVFFSISFKNHSSLLFVHLINIKIMKRLSFLILLAFCMQGCSYSQNSKKTTMKETNTNNPVYSNTDTGSVNLSEEEWKKILPEDVLRHEHHPFLLHRLLFLARRVPTRVGVNHDPYFP